MNWKLILIGGIVFFVAQFVVGMVSGPIIHEGVLDAAYRATASFWRPELMQDPPDMAALMPRWIAAGLLGAFVLAGIYGAIRHAFSGAGYLRGAKYGFVLFLVTATMMIGWSGVFNLPNQIWLWWMAESLVSLIVAGAALGWVAEKFAPGPHAIPDLHGAT
jgi:hypothetical protein